MKLQTERRLEQFLQLVGLPGNHISERMEFSLSPFHLYIECIDNDILLSVGREVELAWQVEVLERLLTAAIPARTQGVPLRPWLLRGRQMLSCTLSASGDIPHWFHCLQTMQRLLDNAIGVKK
jgi:type III secretion system chaperone SycN